MKEAKQLYHGQAKINLELFVTEMRDKFSQKTFDGQEYRDERDKIFWQLKEAAQWLDYE